MMCVCARVYARECVRACVYMYVGSSVHLEFRGQLTEAVLSFQHVGSRNETPVIRLGGKGLYQVSNLIVSSGDRCSI